MTLNSVLRVISTILLGQISSGCVTATSYFSMSLSEDFDFSFPGLQSMFMYIALGFALVPRFALPSQRARFAAFREAQPGHRGPLYAQWWQYFILGLLDAAGNIFMVAAYRYTSVARVMLLDCMSIPVCMAISRFVLGKRYLRSHFVGIGVALFGVAVLVTIDAIRDGWTGSIVGDICAMVGGASYGIGNALQEMAVKKFDTLEYLGCLGVSGALCSGVQAAIFDRKGFKRLPSLPGAGIGNIAGYTAVMLTLYCSNSVLVRLASAVFMNLSLLTADLYAVFIDIFVFDNAVSWVYIIVFIVIMGGTAVYSATPDAPTSTQDRPFLEACEIEPTAEPAGSEAAAAAAAGTVCVDSADLAVAAAVGAPLEALLPEVVAIASAS